MMGIILFGGVLASVMALAICLWGVWRGQDHDDLIMAMLIAAAVATIIAVMAAATPGGWA